MHAASVHPEPGSNSRINCIKITSYEVFQSVRAFFLSFFYFCLSSILFQNFTRSFFALYFCFRFVLLQSLVVQFSMTDFWLYPRKFTALLFYHKSFRLSSLFYHFSKLFSTRQSLPRLRPCYITTTFSFCQYPFLSFFDFFIFFLKKYWQSAFDMIYYKTLTRPVGQAVKTLASHAENMGSIPVRVTK